MRPSSKKSAVCAAISNTLAVMKEFTGPLRSAFTVRRSPTLTFVWFSPSSLKKTLLSVSLVYEILEYTVI